MRKIIQQFFELNFDSFIFCVEGLTSIGFFVVLPCWIYIWIKRVKDRENLIGSEQHSRFFFLLTCFLCISAAMQGFKATSIWFAFISLITGLHLTILIYKPDQVYDKKDDGPPAGGPKPA